MRDPMTWSLKLFRVFGITVRVHFLFIAVVLVLVGREAFFRESAPAGAWWAMAVMCGLLFVSVLLHEFGHCFAARSVDGDASEILMWPLGGLAFVDVPHTPRANFVTVAGGPAVNLGLCALTAVLLGFASYLPSLNPISSPYAQQLYNWREGVYYGSKYNAAPVRETSAGSGEFTNIGWDKIEAKDNRLVVKDTTPPLPVQFKQYGPAINLLAMFFWI